MALDLNNHLLEAEDHLITTLLGHFARKEFSDLTSVLIRLAFHLFRLRLRLVRDLLRACFLEAARSCRSAGGGFRLPYGNTVSSPSCCVSAGPCRLLDVFLDLRGLSARPSQNMG